ncbi:hypothetical protein NUBL22822_28550 [Klebsiella pneumoniae]|nr:hypothetical protein NUBL22822_28550 [Klebsiella pneumoniae]
MVVPDERGADIRADNIFNVHISYHTTATLKIDFLSITPFLILLIYSALRFIFISLS